MVPALNLDNLTPLEAYATNSCSFEGEQNQVNFTQAQQQLRMMQDNHLFEKEKAA